MMSFSYLATIEVALLIKCYLQVVREFSEMHEMCPPNCPLCTLGTKSRIGISWSLPGE